MNSIDNYCKISLQNVISKIYCSLLVSRLNFYVTMYSKISENQSGFKAGHSTIDNAFILKSIIDQALHQKGGKVFVWFLDFHKCFDTIDRNILWQIIKSKGIKGRLFEALRSLYTEVNACIHCSDNSLSPHIQSNVGLKHGCFASPILFSLFTNELEIFLRQNNVRCFQLHLDLMNRIIFDNVCRWYRSNVGHDCWVTKTDTFADFRDLYHLKSKWK